MARGSPWAPRFVPPHSTQMLSTAAGPDPRPAPPCGFLSVGHPAKSVLRHHLTDAPTPEGTHSSALHSRHRGTHQASDTKFPWGQHCVSLNLSPGPEVGPELPLPGSSGEHSCDSAGTPMWANLCAHLVLPCPDQVSAAGPAPSRPPGPGWAAPRSWPPVCVLRLWPPSHSMPPVRAPTHGLWSVTCIGSPLPEGGRWPEWACLGHKQGAT